MRCEVVQGKLSALIDRELYGWQRQRLEHHLGRCAACRRERDALQALEVRLVLAAPLPRPTKERRPVLRPIGVVRPMMALAACAVGLWVAWPLPRTNLIVAQAMATPIPIPSPTPPASVKPHHVPGTMRAHPLRLRVPKRHHRRRSRPAALPEQVVIVVLTPSEPKSLTLVHDSQDDDGGTIHIESTIPPAYVAAMQTASLSQSQGELN